MNCSKELFANQKIGKMDSNKNFKNKAGKQVVD